MAKEFRIFNITRAGDQKRTIRALEYIEEVYQDNVEIPPPEGGDELEPYVEGLSATEVYRREGGNMVAYVHLTWRGFGINYLYMKKDDAYNWSNPIYTSYGDNKYDVKNLEPGS